jgi:hypothetical protein
LDTTKVTFPSRLVITSQLHVPKSVQDRRTRKKCILSSFSVPHIRLQRVQQIVSRKDALTRVAAYAIASAFLRLAGGAL